MEWIDSKAQGLWFLYVTEEIVSENDFDSLPLFQCSYR